jgi:2-methylcitrate dehydratase PrpD
MTKCWHAGHAAMAGTLSALSAWKGYDASPQALDGKVGFTAAFQGNTGKAFPVDRLGNPYFMTSIMFKKYPACHGTHATVDAAMELRSQHGFSPQEIKAVECYGRPLMSSVLIYKDPGTGLQAKFSLEYCVAAALTLGRLGIAQFTDDAVLNPEVRKTMQKLSVTGDEDIEKLARDKNLIAPGRVKVSLDDGRQFSLMIEEARGGPGDPLSWA